jgi:predicted RNA methylase
MSKFFPAGWDENSVLEAIKNIPASFEGEVALINFVSDLYEISLKEPEKVISLLDFLFKNLEKSRLQFYEIPLSNGVIKLFQPPGVSPIIRPSTLHFIEIIFRELNKGLASLLDVGCGCGVISIAAAKNKKIDTVAIDISKLAILTTKINALWNGVSEKITYSHYDFADYNPDRKFDVIAINPPLTPIPAITNKQTLEKFVTIFNNLRNGALDLDSARTSIYYYVTKEGLNILDLIFRRSKDLLTEKGIIVVEIGEDQGDKFLERVLWSSKKNNWKQPEIYEFASSSSDFDRNYVWYNPRFNEFADKNMVKRIIKNGGHIYKDPQMKERILDPEEIDDINVYYLKDRIAVFRQ